MKLSAWLKQQRLTPAEFGKLMGVKSSATVPRYLAGIRRPSKENMKKIKRLTHGKVTADSFQ